MLYQDGPARRLVHALKYSDRVDYAAPMGLWMARAGAEVLEGADLLAHAASEAVAADYARHTDDALAAHIFGVPWYRVDGEGYWGQDRLDFVERALMS